MIEFKELSYQYPKQNHPALNELTFSIPESSYTCLLGQNGSGKSTLARLMNGLRLPSKGALLDTRDSSKIRTIRKSIGLVFQNPSSAMVSSTVFDEVSFGPANLGLDKEEIIKRVDQSLDLVGLKDKLLMNPEHLSGGEKQRLMIASVLVMQPKYLILDEPFSMLDIQNKGYILDVLKRIHAKGTAIVLITHNLMDALDAQRFIVLKKGRIALDCAKDELLDSYESLQEEELLSHPYLNLQTKLIEHGIGLQAFKTPKALLAEVLKGRS
ncbi:MAG: ATP-binding cassette domain-containing protein [Coriobacteriia bacterium]|nr:ATP-binding cassette domain-containing protein [Coriobacteriia bacterium]